MKIINFLLSAIPFLAPYPAWIKVLVALWIVFGASLLIVLLFFRPSTEPQISLSMEHPILVEEKSTRRNTSNPNIIITNNGPISAVSLSANLEIFAYDTNSNSITQQVIMKDESFDHAFATEELKPFKNIKQSTLGITGDNIISIYIVSVLFYRKSDMMSFSIKENFFIQNGDIHNDQEFKTKEYYSIIHDKIKFFKDTQEDKCSFKFTAAAPHTWFMESEEKLLTKRNNKGSITIAGPPQKQNEIPQKGLPHLTVEPKIFETENSYIKKEIIGEKIHVEVQYEVKNIGSKTAIITYDGFTPIIEIGPDQTKTYKKPFEFIRKSSSASSPQEFFDQLKKDGPIADVQIKLLYRVKNIDDLLFEKIASHTFYNNKAELVANDNLQCSQ